MKRYIASVAICAMALLIMAAPAQAQAIPCQSPLAALTGSWVFASEGNHWPPVPPLVYLVSSGRFVASVGTDRAGQPIGVLAIFQSSNYDGTPTRLEADAGRYWVSPDCRRGTLTFNVSSRPVQFDFYFVNPSEIFMVGSNNGDILLARGRRIIPVACPAVPAAAFSGDWVFQWRGVRVIPGSVSWEASSGQMTARVGVDRAGQPIGLLAITATSNYDGSGSRLETDAGRYQVEPGCLGGTLTLNLSSRPMQFDFFFVNPCEIVFVGAQNGDVVVGRATRFGCLLCLPAD